MGETKKKYTEPTSKLAQHLMFVFLFAPLCIFWLFIMIRDLINEFDNPSYKQFTPLVFLIIVGFITLLGCIVAICDLWNRAVIIVLDDEKLNGYPRFGKKKWEMRFEDIIYIGPPTITLWSILIRDKNNNRILVSQFAYPLGECMNFIKERAVNAEKIDLRKWKDDKKLWGE